MKRSKLQNKKSTIINVVLLLTFILIFLSQSPQLSGISITGAEIAEMTEPASFSAEINNTTDNAVPAETVPGNTQAPSAAPAVSNISDAPDPQGFGLNVTIQAAVTNASTVLAGITPPSAGETNYTMANIGGNNYARNYSNWTNGTYTYKIYANDSGGIWNSSSAYTFSLYQNLTIQAKTLKDSYTTNESINITDPDDPDSEAPAIAASSFAPDTELQAGDNATVTIISVADKYGASDVTAEIPTNNGTDVVQLVLVNSTAHNRTWQASWTAHDVIDHFVILVTATNALNKTSIDYISVGDPPGLWALPNNDSDPTGLWTNRQNARDGDTHTYSRDTSNPGPGWGSFITFNTTMVESDRARVWADYGAQVNATDIDIFKDGSWTDVYQGPISKLSWYEANYTKGNVTAGRFRFYYNVSGWIYWLYEFQFYNFTTKVNMPVVSTRAATSVEETTAVLHATVLSDGGDASQVRFLYGNSISYTNSTPWLSSQYTGSSIAERLYGLQNGATYHFIAQINNSAGVTNGSDKEFTTGAPPVGWVSATGYEDPTGEWADEIYAFDDELSSETHSYHEVNDPNGTMSFYLYLNRSPPVSSDKIRFNAKAVDVDLATVDIYNGSSWVTVYNSSFVDSTWTTASFNQTNISQARVRFRAIADNRGFEWRLAEFNFYRTVATPPENQSKMDNGGPTSASCYLFMKTQYWNASLSAWQNDDTVVNETTPRQLQPFSLLKLDAVWNLKNYKTNNLSFGDGAYRIYAACLDTGGNVLKNLDGSYVNTTHNFNCDVAPPRVSITSPANGTNYTLGSTMLIKANVTDMSGISSVVANISLSIGYEEVPLVYNATSGLWEGAYSNTNYVDTYKIQMIATDASGMVNSTEFVNIRIIDVASPAVILDYPPDNYVNASPSVNITFRCNATDNYNVNNISLYITNSSNQLFSLNATIGTSGVSTYAYFNKTLSSGNYTWNCLAYDSSGNFDWGDANRSMRINYTAPVDNPPRWSNNQTNIVSTYSPATPSYFNITWQDEYGISKVWLESNYSGSAQNYTMNSIGRNIYNYSAILPAGTWYWKSYANDTTNQWNTSSTWTFTINKSAPVLTITNSTPIIVAYGTQTNISCTANTAEVTPQLFRNNSSVSSPDVQTLAAGIYIYTCNNTATQNYTASSAVQLNVSVNQAATILTLTASPNWTNTYPTQTTVNCTANNAEVTPKLYINGANVSNPYITIHAAENYNYTCNNSASQNYTDDSASNNLTINKAAGLIYLYLNGSRDNITANLGSAINHTAILVSPATGNVELYRNSNLMASGSSPLTNISTYNAGGVYNITAFYNETQNYTSSYETYFITVQDLENPTIISTTINPYDPVVGYNVTLNASAADNGAVDGIFANITLPNGTTITLPMSANYTVQLVGRHNVTFWANDTSGNIGAVEDYFIAGILPVNITFNAINYTLAGLPVNLTIYFAGTDKQVHMHEFTGTKLDDHTNILYDLFYSALDGNISVRLNDVNLSIDNNNTVGLDRLTAVSGFLVTYGIYSTYNSTSAEVAISYAGTNYTDETRLELYKCDDWNFTARTCSSGWTLLSGIQNETDDTFTFTTTSFSAFSVKQASAAAQPSAPSAGGVGGIISTPQPVELPPATAHSKPIYYIGDFKTADIFTPSIGTGEFWYFTYKEINYSVEIASIAGNTVELKVTSKPLYITLKAGEIKTADVDGDGIYDILIGLNSIEDGHISITLKLIPKVLEKIRPYTMNKCICLLIILFIIFIILAKRRKKEDETKKRKKRRKNVSA